MKVLIVASEFPPDVGGIASHVSELAMALEPLVESVAVIHPRGFGDRVAGAETWSFPVCRPQQIMGEPFYQIMLARMLSRVLAREPADIVHVHGVRPLGATRSLPVPTVFTNHSSGFLARLNASARRKRLTARLLEHVRYVIGPSDELVEAARAFAYRGPAAMIPNGVDITRFRPGASRARESWGIGSEEVVILLARRLVPKNGVVDFARALGFLKHLSFRVVVAGDGPDRGSMVEILNAAGMLDRVLFLGAVANANMPQVYQAADIAVLPSLAEATSIAGLEAMATALPLVGTRVGGIPAIVADGETGLLVTANEPQALSGALGRMIADCDMRRRFGAAGRRRVEREFSWPIIAGRTLSVYRECLAAWNSEGSGFPRAPHASAGAAVFDA